MSNSTENAVLTAVTEYLKYNGFLRKVENYQPTEGDKPSAAFIHKGKEASQSNYLYVELELAELECIDDQTSAIGTALFEGSRLWKKLVGAMDDPDNSKITVIVNNGEITMPFRGAFITVDLEEPVERWWQKTKLKESEARSENNGQWTIVESTQVYISRGDDLTKSKGKAIRSIMNKVKRDKDKQDSDRTKEYRTHVKLKIGSDIPAINEAVNKDAVE